MNMRKRAFIPCYRHGTFTYSCHDCLVESVIQLSKIVENQEHPKRKRWWRRK